MLQWKNFVRVLRRAHFQRDARVSVKLGTAGLFVLGLYGIRRRSELRSTFDHWMDGRDFISVMPRSVFAESGDDDVPLPTRSARFNFIADVVESISPGVVFLQIQGRHPVFPGVANTSQGSGFLVREDGLILTNAHVVADQVHVEVKLPDGRRLPGRVMYRDTASDLAAVKIQGDNLPALKLGSSSKLRVGEWIVAVGSPLNFSNTVTTGIVSALRGSAELGLTHGDKRSINYIQTDASITFGNSGGPLLNLDGEVIGINTMMASPGISFAIPIDHAKDFLSKIDSIEKATGRKSSGLADPVRPQKKSIGITMLTMTPEILAAVQQRSNSFDGIISGVLIHRVLPGSPAEKAGLRSGDVVTEINSRPISTTKDVYEAVEHGKELDIAFRRGGALLGVRLKPELAEPKD